MILTCTNEFGNFKPGDELEVPDEVGFDHRHFEIKTEKPARAAKKAEEK